MTTRIVDMPRRKAAIIAGFALLAMTILAIFANYFVFSNLILPENAAATAANIMANESLFRIGICSFIFVAVLDVVVAWALYVFLKQVNSSLSLLAALFRLVYAAIFVAALANYFNVLLLLSGANYLTVFEPEQLRAQLMIFLNAFTYGWDIGGVFLGIHLFFLGYLVFRLDFPGRIPRILGVLLIIAAFGYLIDSFGKFLVPGYKVNVAMFTFVGEPLFMLWLLWRGAKGFKNLGENS